MINMDSSKTAIIYYILSLLTLIPVVLTSDEVNLKGAYHQHEVSLPCKQTTPIPQYNRTSVWWSTQGKYIGMYTETTGFQPSEVPEFANKFDMESLSGSLIIVSTNKSEDAGVYNCGIEMTDGTNVTDTVPVQLEIGNKISNFRVYTNGSELGDSGCYEHIGLGSMTCAVVSDPNSTISWRLTSIAGSGQDCYDFPYNLSCVPFGDQYNCTSSMTPNCYGSYECKAVVEIGDLNDSEFACMVVAESEDWWVPIYTFIVILSVLAALLLVCLVSLVCCGVVSCSVCACAGCAICASNSISSSSNRDPQTQYELNQVYTSYPENEAASNKNSLADDPPPYKEKE